MWVFGYGSLIWDPGFVPAERQVARLEGWHRSFCMLSFHYRGTPEQPGLVLALDRQAGAACDGVAFRVRPGEEDAVRAYLRARELISSAYLEAELGIRLADGRDIDAMTYVIDRAHTQYCAGLNLREQAAVIAVAHGDKGSNRDYLHNTVAHLKELGLGDPDLEWLAATVREITTKPDPLA